MQMGTSRRKIRSCRIQKSLCNGSLGASERARESERNRCLHHVRRDEPHDWLSIQLMHPIAQPPSHPDRSRWKTAGSALRWNITPSLTVRAAVTIGQREGREREIVSESEWERGREMQTFRQRTLQVRKLNHRNDLIQMFLTYWLPSQCVNVTLTQWGWEDSNISGRLWSNWPKRERERKLKTGLVKLFPPSGPSAGCDLNQVMGQVHTRGEETQHQLQASALGAAGPAGPGAALERKILCTCEEKMCASDTGEVRECWVKIILGFLGETETSAASADTQNDTELGRFDGGFALLRSKKKGPGVYRWHHRWAPT